MIVKILTASGWKSAEQLELFPGKGLSLIANLCYGNSDFMISDIAQAYPPTFAVDNLIKPTRVKNKKSS